MKRRAGSVNNMWVMVLGSAVLVAILVWLLVGMPDRERTANLAANGSDTSAAGDAGKSADPDTANQSLLLFCAAGIKLPVEAAANAFERELGVEVELQYGGSGTLLTNLRVAKKGDLYLAADASYIELARKQDLLAEAIPLARLRPVIAVRKGNPKNIRSVDDLLRDDVQFALANPDAASIGRTTKKILEKTGQWEAIEPAAKVFKPTVNDVAADVRLGAVDATFVWDSTVGQYPDLEVVRVPIFDAAEQDVTIGVLKTCRKPATALRFARYLQAPEKGQKEFERYGFETIAGDPWAETPTITLYSGGVNRLAIQETLRRFEQREGVSIIVQYNGCGILVAQMKAGSYPDAYFACDASFMMQVRDSFQPALTVSQTDMVIIVPKGNPKGIKGLSDVTQPNLKLGVANEEQSALGALTKRLLETQRIGGTNLYDAVQPNISVRTPTADLLVNQVRVRGLDAAIVYRANVAAVTDKVEIITIKQGNPVAVQPIAVGKKSRFPYLAGRLVEAISSSASRQRFEDVGFQWRAGLR